jgi:hypothetical protein
MFGGKIRIYFFLGDQFVGRKLVAPKQLSKNQQRKWLDDQIKEMNGAAERGQERFDNYGGNYIRLTFDDVTRIPGFGHLLGYELSESRSKYYRTSSTGWSVIMDLSKTYFRLQNPAGDYVDMKGKAQDNTAEQNADFLARSHFRTS